MSVPRALTDRQLKELGTRLHTDAGMAELMDECFGQDGWVYEPATNCGSLRTRDTRGRAQLLPRPPRRRLDQSHIARPGAVMSAHDNFVPDPSWPTIVELATELWGQPTKAGGLMRFAWAPMAPNR